MQKETKEMLSKPEKNKQGHGRYGADEPEGKGRGVGEVKCPSGGTCIPYL